MSDESVVALRRRIRTERERRPGRLVGNPWVVSGLVFVGFLAFWEWAVGFFGLPAILLPAPSRVAAALWADAASGLYLKHGITTLEELAWGFSVGTALGVIVAALLTQSQLLERVLYPYVIALQTFPKIAIAPLLITWFGFGIGPKAILAGMLAFFPVLINMMVGLRAVDEAQVELLRSFATSRWKIFRLCRLPASLPFFFAGIETGIVLAMLGAITGEFVGARTGLGYLVVQKNSVMAIDSVFALLVVLGVLGVGLHLAVRAIHRKVVFWE
jgi:NitT/TauT family transport system permease protein